MNCYYLYGLTVSSEWPLPFPQAAKSNCEDVELAEGIASVFASALAEAADGLRETNGARYARLEEGADYICWPELFEFMISPDGRRISGRALSEGKAEAFYTYLLGQVMSYALLKQGIEPLHATVLAVDGAAVALLGDSGYGKSSLGAAFLQTGARMITDDLLVLKETGGEWLAYPGPARIKLFPETARTLLGDRVTGFPMNPYTPKIVVGLSEDQTGGTATRLKAIYRLPSPTTKCSRKEVRITRRSERQACLSLIASTFNTDVRTPTRMAQQFSMATRLAKAVGVKTLSYERRLERLPYVVDAVVSDLSRV